MSDNHRARLEALLEDARAKGARVEVLGSASDGHSRRLAPALVFGPTPTMRVMQEEIFGPILPMVSYRALDEALAFIAARPRPLAFYYFDDDANRAQDVLRRTPSGGACVNDTLVHFAQESLPFGGIGASGQGAYHGAGRLRDLLAPAWRAGGEPAHGRASDSVAAVRANAGCGAGVPGGRRAALDADADGARAAATLTWQAVPPSASLHARAGESLVGLPDLVTGPVFKTGVWC